MCQESLPARDYVACKAVDYTIYNVSSSVQNYSLVATSNYPCIAHSPRLSNAVLRDPTML